MRARRWPVILAASALLPALIAAAAAPGQSAAGATREENDLRVDGFERLSDDPSSEASRRLRRMYERSPGKDARFWIVQALGSRLQEQADAGALDALLAASADRAPEVRGSALRAMAAFAVLPRSSLGEAVLARLDLAVDRGRADRSPSVKQGAEELGQTLSRYRSRGALPAAAAQAPWDGQRTRRTLAWAWAALLAALLGAWATLGLPVFDGESRGGRLARASWEVLSNERAFIVLLAAFWVCLTLTLAGHALSLLGGLSGSARALGGARWLGAYFVAGFCVLAPGVVACARIGAGRPLRGLFFLRDMPRAAALSVAVFGLLGPAELIYRLLLRRAPAHRRRLLRRVGPRAILEAGSFRSAYLVSAVMANEGHGLAPAFGRAARIEARLPPKMGFSAFDSGFTLYFAAPVLGGLYLLFSRVLPMEWTAPRLLAAAACALWAWLIIAVMLFAVLQVMDAVVCAVGYLEARGRAAPQPLARIIEQLGGFHD